jgi:hypothetical protein
MPADCKEGKLISKRRLKTLLHEVPAGEREDYKEFAKKVQDDYGLFISFTSVRESQATASQPKSLRLPSSKTFDAIRNLPDSPSAEALRLEKEARSTGKHDVQTLTSLPCHGSGSQFIAPGFARRLVTFVQADRWDSKPSTGDSRCP